MDRKKVKSKIIKSIGYDENAQLLEVEFHNFEITRYINITKETYTKLMKAPSKGSFFIQNISEQFPSRVIRVKKKRFTFI